jgi:hypothetical protein
MKPTVKSSVSKNKKGSIHRNVVVVVETAAPIHNKKKGS